MSAQYRVVAVVFAFQKQVDHHLDQVFFIECGDRVVRGLVGRWWGEPLQV